MEARATYGPWQERPRLIMVKDGGASYAALPHAVLFDNEISPGSRLFFAGLQTYWWKSGICYASHATLATDFNISERQVQRYLRELIDAGHITERQHGRGNSKAYVPVNQTDLSGSPVSNTTDLSPLPSNQTDLSLEPDRSVVVNQTDLSCISNRSEEDTYGSKNLESDAANAAPAPVVIEPKVKSDSRASRLPADWTLSDAHLEIAAKHGFDTGRAQLEGEKFSDHHRAKGNRMVDWLAAWRTWIRNAVRFDAPSPRPHRNGAGQVPPGAASKQASKWSDRPMRHGYHSGGSPDGR